MLYYLDINTRILSTVSGVSDTLTWRATLRLQLVYIIKVAKLSPSSQVANKF